MRRLFCFWVIAAIAGVLGRIDNALAATTRAELILSADTARPGDTITAGVRLRMNPTWHVYWRNSGDSGIPTEIKWKLPAGISATNILWPVPKKDVADDLTTYDYDEEVIFLVPLTISASAASGPITLHADVIWLECALNGSCVPGKSSLEANLTVGSESKPSANAGLLDTWRKRLPLDGSKIAATAKWEGNATTNGRSLLIEWPGDSPPKPDFFPYSKDKYEMAGKTEHLDSDTNKVRIRKQVKKEDAGWPASISGLLVERLGSSPIAYEVTLPITGGDGAANTPGSTENSGLIVYLLSAFVGGLILNVMPCVLPVIALKILGFVGEAHENPARVRRLGLVYCLGVLASFLALATLVIVAKNAGKAVTWGTQLQDPRFVVVLTVLMTLVALNLFGVFEVSLGSRTLSAAGTLASRSGYAGAFFNGLLATLLATSCTAPYMVTAVGFALNQSALVIALIFMFLGLGLAAPYLVLSWQPAWLKFLPKPGLWMERFKVIMGFPVLATAIWLFTLATTNFGENGDLWLGLFLLTVGLAAWLWGQFVQRGTAARPLAVVICLFLTLGAYGFLLEHLLDWRHPAVGQAGRAKLEDAPAGIDWVPWSPETLAAARAKGRPVLVDFTAKWCLNCQLYVRPVLSSESVRSKIKEVDASALLESSYVKSPAANAEINRYAGGGVPLVLVYPANPDAPPEVLPAIPTPGIVVAALERAAKNTAPAAITARERQSL